MKRTRLVAPKPVLSICTGIGLLDRAFIDEGFRVVPGCEIEESKRNLYRQVCGDHEFITGSLQEMITELKRNPRKFQGIIGGPPCQAHTRIKRKLKVARFPDLNPLVVELVELVKPDWYVFENVVPIGIPREVKSRCNAMHYAKPHQSRGRYFSHSSNIKKPEPLYCGTAWELMAHVCVSGQNYDTRRAGILQGYPDAYKLQGDYRIVLNGIVNAVHYDVARAWAKQVKAR